MVWILLRRWNFFGSLIFALVTLVFQFSVFPWGNALLQCLSDPILPQLSLWLTTLLSDILSWKVYHSLLFFLITWWSWLLDEPFTLFSWQLSIYHNHGHSFTTTMGTHCLLVDRRLLFEMASSLEVISFARERILKGNTWLWPMLTMQCEVRWDMRDVRLKATLLARSGRWEIYLKFISSLERSLSLSLYLLPSLLLSLHLTVLPMRRSLKERFIDMWPVQPRVLLSSNTGAHYNHIKKSDSPITSLSISWTGILSQASGCFTTPLANSPVH